MMPTVKIAVTGSEGSGKTVLALGLAKYFSCPLVRDVSEYYLNKHAVIHYETLIEIANYKIEVENELLKELPEILIADNELISLKIWAEYRFNKFTSDLKSLIDSQYYDLYILTKPENQTHYKFLKESASLKDYFFNAFVKELEDNKLPYIIAEGDFYMRKKKAVAEIMAFTKRNRILN